MDGILNLKLLAHPVNWLIVWVVLLLAATGYTFIHDGALAPTSV